MSQRWKELMNRPTATLGQVDISVEDVCKRLKAVKTDKLPGPDGINPALLKGLTECLAVPMCISEGVDRVSCGTYVHF